MDRDETAKGIVVTGAVEKDICAGIKVGAACNIYKPIRLNNKPTIAVINGIAAGSGFQIALVADQRVAHKVTRMGQLEINAAIHSIMCSH